MKAIDWKRLRIVVPVVFIACLFTATHGAVTLAPQNAIGLREDRLILECEASSDIEWLRDTTGVTGDGCSSLTFDTETGSTATDCNLVVQGTSSMIISGPFTCFDGSANAEAAVIIIDPAPTCGLVSSGPILRNSDVTFVCSMQYYYRSTLGTRPRATLSASIAWQSEAGSNPTTYTPDIQNDDSIKLQVDVKPDTSGTEIPSYSCTSTFEFTDPGTQTEVQLAVNTVTWTCNSASVVFWYCPTAVSISPSTGPFTSGDVLTCSSDGYPDPSFSWTDSSGAEVSTASTMTLSGGDFELTCTATGNFTTPCSSTATVSDFALGCPTNVASSPSGGNVMVGTVITCSSTGGVPDATYQWLDQDGTVLSTSATVTAPTTEGDFNYTCVATSTYQGRTCTSMVSASGTFLQEVPSTTPSSSNGNGGTGTATDDGSGSGNGNTTADSSGQNGNGTTDDTSGASSGTSIFKILTIVFSVLIGLGLIWILLLTAWLLEWYPAYEERRRRKWLEEKVDRERPYPPVRRPPRPIPPYSNVYGPNYLPYY